MKFKISSLRRIVSYKGKIQPYYLLLTVYLIIVFSGVLYRMLTS